MMAFRRWISALFLAIGAASVGPMALLPASAAVTIAADDPTSGVSPQPPSFDDADRTITIPADPNFTYELGDGAVLAAGSTSTGPGVVTVRAIASEGVSVADGATTEWTHTFGPRTMTTATPTVDGKAQFGSTLTAHPGAWTAGVNFAYQWLADGSVIAGATAPTFTPGLAQLGARISVTVTGSAADYVTAAETSQETAPVVAAPFAGAAPRPRVSGRTTFGSTLTATVGAWAPHVVLSYRWYRDGEPIPGATKTTHRVTLDDIGSELQFVVTGRLPGYENVVRYSSILGPMSRASFTGPKPVLRGRAIYGQVLTATVGRWPSGTTLSYRWSSNGHPIAGATTTRYRVGRAVIGRRLTFAVVAKRRGYNTTSATSLPTAKVVPATLRTSAPTVVGTVQVDHVVRARIRGWTSGTAFTVQWYANGRPIRGATHAVYKLAPMVAGRRITVRVHGSKAGYRSAVRTSRATAKVKLGRLRTSAPRISGTPALGRTLTVTPGTWSKGSKVRFQWYLGGKAISGAHGRSVRPNSTTWVGKRISVSVSGSKRGYATAQRFSTATSKVYIPGSTDPVSEWDCPSWAAIKGNADSHIYHMPGGEYYDRTKPEVCFSSEHAAQSAGYRKSKR